jgi:glucose-1-phosphate cytidylyltransferase
MKVGILCGGLGTRLSEETATKPKPMVEIGGRPILWHIMKMYAACGFKEFVLALGYKGEVIKDYFLNYRYHSRSLTVSLASGAVTMHEIESREDWVVHLLDTGADTNTGGRVKQVAQFVGNETFMLTYGDGVSNVDISGLLDFHRRMGKLATVTAVHPPPRFGGILPEGDMVVHFAEKPLVGEGWINGGFYVLEPGIAGFVPDNQTLWEGMPMERLAAQRQLAAYQHLGFWQCMDTWRDVRHLEGLWGDGHAPWRTW